MSELKMREEKKKERRREIFFFKQKTAYEIKECDWSSDVCSSDLILEDLKIPSLLFVVAVDQLGKIKE